MILEFPIRYWSLAVAGVLATAIVLFLGFRVFSDSARGQLRSQLRALRRRYKKVDRARSRVRKAHARLERLRAKAASVKPRRVHEAAEALADARSLLKIAEDQVLIAENYVRRIIVEEFPPKRQESLRQRYLRPPRDRDKPFTF